LDRLAAETAVILATSDESSSKQARDFHIIYQFLPALMSDDVDFIVDERHYPSS
jgi:hypothetical protein